MGVATSGGSRGKSLQARLEARRWLQGAVPGGLLGTRYVSRMGTSPSLPHFLQPVLRVANLGSRELKDVEAAAGVWSFGFGGKETRFLLHWLGSGQAGLGIPLASRPVPSFPAPACPFRVQPSWVHLLPSLIEKRAHVIFWLSLVLPTDASIRTGEHGH